MIVVMKSENKGLLLSILYTRADKTIFLAGVPKGGKVAQTNQKQILASYQ